MVLRVDVGPDAPDHARWPSPAARAKAQLSGFTRRVRVVISAVTRVDIWEGMTVVAAALFIATMVAIVFVSRTGY